MLLEHDVEHAALGPAIRGLAGESENLAERETELPLDFRIELDKWDIEMPRQPVAQRRFARPAQSDQGDPAMPRLAVGFREMRVE